MRDFLGLSSKSETLRIHIMFKYESRGTLIFILLAWRAKREKGTQETEYMPPSGNAT